MGSATDRRGLISESAVPGVIGAIIVIGTVRTILFSYLLAVANVRLRLLPVAIVSVSLSLVIVMVLALNQPFRGEPCISKAPFELAIESMPAPRPGVRK